LIDDENQKTLAAASDLELVKSKKTIAGSKKGGAKLNIAKEVGKLIAEKAKKAKIEKVVFDRGGFVFHGRIKSLAEGAREAGIKF
jgi:large subunit ribosomal protein L18